MDNRNKRGLAERRAKNRRQGEALCAMIAHSEFDNAFPQWQVEIGVGQTDTLALSPGAATNKMNNDGNNGEDQ
jgi:hypothetical protein